MAGGVFFFDRNPALKRSDRMIPSTYEARLADSLPEVRERIATAAERSGRDADDITLVAVTKAHPMDAVHAALTHDLFHVGENRVEELEWKAASLDDERVQWHMIGHVQRRKVPRLLGKTDLIHSVDSLRLARQLSDRSVEAGEVERVLIQVNTSGEKTKGGFSVDGSVEELSAILKLPGLDTRGLMTMAPFTDDEAVLRRTFRRVRMLHDELRGVEGYSGVQLSMGMTNDFEVAIEEGSTMIRIGTALFGRRSTHD